jgi:hypothetical protein
MDKETLSLITIPIFTGAIGYVTNLSGVWMLFYPIRFRGIRLPGLKALANVLRAASSRFRASCRAGLAGRA